MFIFKVDQFIEFSMFSTLNVLISLGIFHWGYSHQLLNEIETKFRKQETFNTTKQLYLCFPKYRA